MIDTLLRDQIARDECPGGKPVLKAYRDSKQLWTIGVGHLLHTDPKVVVPRVTEVTLRESDAWFLMDMEGAIADLTTVFTVAGVARFDAPRWRAAVNMSFNRGLVHMRDSTTITPAIKLALAGVAGWSAVGDAIRKSPWAKDIKSRAERLAVQFETGRDQ